MRWIQHRGHALMPVVTVNYMVAAGMAGLWLAWAEGQMLAAPLYLYGIGLLNGLAYIAHLMIMFVCIKRVGVGIAATVASMTAVSPVLWSWAVHGQMLSTYQTIALVLVPVVMFLCRAAADKNTAAVFDRRTNVYLLLNFVIGSLIGVLHGEVNYVGEGVQPIYLGSLYMAAAASSLLVLLLQRQAVKPTALRSGFILGLANGLGTGLILLALKYLPAIAVFPVAGCAVIIGSALIGVFYWKEYLLQRQRLGLCAAVLVIVLINLHQSG